MVGIIDASIIDPTLEAMRTSAEKNQRKESRNYVGASGIGKECARQIWYNYKGFSSKPIPSSGLFNIEDGYRTEELTANRLKMVDGIELVTHRKNGEQFGFSDLNNKFKGHCDGFIRGLIQAPKTEHVWECKSSGHKAFSAFKKAKEKFGDKNALKEWNYTYYVQAQLYMHYFGMSRHYTTVALSGGRDYLSCRTEYKESIALKYIERAKGIINAVEPPKRIREEPDYYICKMCNFKEICHNE